MSKSKADPLLDGNMPPGVIADYLLKTEHVLVTLDNEEVFVYRDGLYQRDGDKIIKDRGKELLGAAFSGAMWREILHHIKSSGHTERDIFDRDPDIINVANGLLNIKSRKLYAHTPGQRSTVRIPLVYNSSAKCPAIHKFLSDTLRPQDIPTMLEYIGYTLYRGYPIQKWLLLTGQGANGKSTLLDLVSTFVGHANCSGCSIQTLITRDFSQADLYRKLVNVCADLPSKGLTDTALVKQLTGNDLIRGEFKYGQSFYFKNYAKLMFSANTPPKVHGDDSMAFWRRLLMIDLPNTFEGDDADPYILKRLTTRRELSGLLNIALDSLRELLRRGSFAQETPWQEVAKAYKMKSDPVPVFVDDCCELDAGHWTTADSLYHGYSQYCSWLSLLPKDRVQFFRDLNTYCDSKVAPQRRDTARKARETGYRGIAIVRPPMPVSIRPSTFVEADGQC